MSAWKLKTTSRGELPNPEKAAEASEPDLTSEVSPEEACLQADPPALCPVEPGAEAERWLGMADEMLAAAAGSCDDMAWQAGFWRSAMAGVLARYTVCAVREGVLPRPGQEQSRFLLYAGILADWVERDLLAGQAESVMAGALCREERRWWEVMTRLPSLTKTLVETCGKMLETLVEQGDGFKVMFRMLPAMNDRCPQAPGQPPEIMIQRADFNEALRVSFNPAASVEAAMAAAKEGYLEARAKNGATLSGLNERLGHTFRQIRKFVQENVLPLKDALGEHLPSGDSSLGEAWAGLQAELGDYLSRIGVRTIPAACGQPFDPEVHEPLAVSPGDGDGGDVVAKVILPGYEIHMEGLRTGRLLVRRVMVEVRTSGKVKDVES